jgi:hypothetical protein
MPEPIRMIAGKGIQKASDVDNVDMCGRRRTAIVLPVVLIVTAIWLLGAEAKVQLMPTVLRLVMGVPPGPIAVQENVLGWVPAGTVKITVVCWPGGAGGGGDFRVTGTDKPPTCMRLSVAVAVTVYVPAAL